MRQNDSLTESINQWPLEKSTPYSYTLQHISSQRQTQDAATKTHLLLLIYYCVPLDWRVHNSCSGITASICLHLVYSATEKKNLGLYIKRSWKHAQRKLCNVVEKNSKVRYEERKCSGQTHLSIIPWSLCSHPPSQPPITKRRNASLSHSSEIHRLYIRTQFGLVMRLRLCISPCRQPNLQLPAHMGALLSRKALRK